MKAAPIGECSKSVCIIHKMLVSRAECFINNLGVMELRETLNEINITVDDFMKNLRWLYSQFSYVAAGSMHHYRNITKLMKLNENFVVLEKKKTI